MAYNAATSIYDCSEMMKYDIEVNINMADKPLLDVSGQPTKQWYSPKPYNQ